MSDLSKLEERELHEMQVRQNSIQMQIPYGFNPDTNVDEVLSHADKIANYILSGEFPINKLSLTPLPFGG